MGWNFAGQTASSNEQSYFEFFWIFRNSSLALKPFSSPSGSSLALTTCTLTCCYICMLKSASLFQRLSIGVLCNEFLKVFFAICWFKGASFNTLNELLYLGTTKKLSEPVFLVSVLITLNSFWQNCLLKIAPLVWQL